MTYNLRPIKKDKKKPCVFLNLWYTTPMINRKDQIHATLYNAAIDGAFSLSVEDGEIVATDLLWANAADKPPKFVIRFVGSDISDVDVEIDNGVRMGA